MKKSWFLHEQLSESQALELAERYRKKNCPVEKSLSSDFISWELRVLLSESSKPPRINRTFTQKMWRD
ncbi:hypothetical protein [Klebsiella sp. 141162]|uniref:hypothetical protein n=1 Tax=Klebsiella sp. 141162 TaxID=3020032 RepID=UPI003D35963C